MKYNITINRIALLVTLGCIQISITGCSQVKNLIGRFSKNTDIEDASPQTVEELRVTYIPVSYTHLTLPTNPYV